MKCPACKRIIIDINDEGTVRMRTKLVLAKEHRMLIMCPNCRKVIEIPIKIDEQLKALATR